MNTISNHKPKTDIEEDFFKSIKQAPRHYKRLLAEMALVYKDHAELVSAYSAEFDVEINSEAIRFCKTLHEVCVETPKVLIEITRWDPAKGILIVLYPRSRFKTAADCWLQTEIWLKQHNQDPDKWTPGICKIYRDKDDARGRYETHNIVSILSKSKQRKVVSEETLKVKARKKEAELQAHLETMSIEELIRRVKDRSRS